MTTRALATLCAFAGACIRPAFVARLSLLAVVLLLTSGCVTAIFLPAVGARTDELAHLDRAMSNGDELIVFYRINTNASMGGRRIASDVPRWSRLDLKTVKWVPFTGRTTEFTNQIRLNIEGGRSPVPALPYTDVPIIPIPTHFRRQTAALEPYLVSTAQPHALSIHGHFDPKGGTSYSLTLVQRRGDGPGQLLYNDRVYSPRREYLTWWAIPARIALFPFTLALDVLASPLYLLCIVGGCSM